jgi:hypothetical protein
LALVAFITSVCAADAAPAQQSSGAVPMSAEVQRRLGVQTTRLSVAHHASETDAFAKVLDPAPLVQLDSDLRTAEAAAAASKAEADRSVALQNQGGAVAAKDAEAAVAQARSDALKVEVLRRQVGLAWGPGIARLNPRRREQLVKGLSAGSIALVHVDTHNNEGQDGAKSVRIDIGDKSVVGRVLGPARTAEPRLQSSGLIVEVTGQSSVLLAVGLVQSAHIATTTAQPGVIIARSAVVRYEGSDWAYVRSGPARFERRLVLDPVPDADGFFVTKGFSSGDEVVVTGAAALFAAELSPTIRAN